MSRSASRRRSRYPSRRYLIPLTAVCISAAVLLLQAAGVSRQLEQTLSQWGGGLAQLFPQQTILLDVPATDSPTMALPDWEAEEFEASTDIQDAPSAPVPPQDSAQAVTITGGGNQYDPGRVYIKNLTDYVIDTAKLLQAKHSVAVEQDDPDLPQVLIVHTHGTEAYTPGGSDTYTASGSYRTPDSKQNVLRVGDEIARVLNQRGIGTVHSTLLHDYPSYSGAYSRSLEDIKAWLKKYPSIRLVIDVHRDALMEGDTVYKTMAQIEGSPCAQLMLVTGTDGGNLRHPNWQENAAFQVQLHHALNTAYPSIMRPMSFRAGRYNQHMTTGSMLVEVGTCGNTLQEALTAARLFGETLADLLLG